MSRRKHALEGVAADLNNATGERILYLYSHYHEIGFPADDLDEIIAALKEAATVGPDAEGRFTVVPRTRQEQP